MCQAKFCFSPSAFLVVLLAVFGIALPATAKGCPLDLDVDVAFSLDLGDTITDAQGTHHFFFGVVEDNFELIYPPEYWGTFPLYFFGTNVGTTVFVTHNGKSNCEDDQDENDNDEELQLKALNLWISNEVYALNADGSSGPEITAPTMIEMEILPSETKTYNATFLGEYQPGLEPGLSRFLVKIYRVNKNSKVKKNGKVGKFLQAREFIFGL